jgi:hypothetical protein
MLRLLVVLLVLANALYFAWSHGHLASYGFAPVAQGEPQRLAQQINPEQMRVAGLDDAGKEPATTVVTAPPTPAAAECLQAGVFSQTQTAVLSTALADALPAGSWALESAVEPARWIVYMGRYASLDAAIKKRGELRGLNVASELVTGAPLAPGLSLGGFDTEAEATSALALVSRRGVKTAGIRQDRPEVRGQRLKLPAVSAELRSQLDALKPQLAGKVLQACA